jgi:SSS family solute:Na+ symporter
VAVFILGALLLYGILVAYFSHKGAEKTKNSSTEYAVAGRSVGAVALLGTVCLSIWSALAFYGYGAGLYRNGVGYFSGVAGACFVGFYAPTIMYRLWLLGKEYDYTTPSDFFSHRYNSRFFTLLVALICVIFVIPYIALQIIGVANGIVVTSQGAIGFWLVVGILTVYIVGHVLKGGSNSIVFTDTLAGFAGVGIALISSP